MPRKLSKEDLQGRATAKGVSKSGSCKELRERLGLKPVKRGAACSRAGTKRDVPAALKAWNQACKEAGYMQKGVRVSAQKLPKKGTVKYRALKIRQREILA